eukprot:TRINITY_DN7121_c0_g1_i6.p1 TRINITY_DN7121_c0_g1~~TRINITY_DN7121_c0_g1_i6.p1  ORF type:complete len:333 (-),score=83.86 TRINITY_DN7121_c0_g1_i6:126-1124(-)
MGDLDSVMLNGLNYWTTDRQVEEVMSEFGSIRKVRFYEDKLNGKSKGICYVIFHNPDSAVNASKTLTSNFVLDGKDVTLDLANSRQIEGQVNTHNMGRKERREHETQKKDDIPPIHTGGGGGREGGREVMGRGRGRGGRGFHRGGYMRFPVEGMVDDHGYPPDDGHALDFIPPAPPITPFPFLPAPGYHVNPSFLPGTVPYPEEYIDYHRMRERGLRERDRDRERGDRERSDRERSDRERSDRERSDRERSDRERSDRERSDRERSDRERERSDRERSDRERDRERGDRDREREARERSDRRDRNRERERSPDDRSKRKHSDRSHSPKRSRS